VVWQLTLRISIARLGVLSLLLAACRVERTPGANSDSAASAGDSARRKDAAGARGSATSAAVPAGFVRRADSVLTRRLALALWDAGVTTEPPLEDCNQLDDGPHPAFVAARVRVLRESAPRLEGTSGSLDVGATFKVEITSVASLERISDDSARAEYDVTVRPRVDTADMAVLQLRSTGKWSVCDLLRYSNGKAAFPDQGWLFAQARDTSIALVKWIPSRANRDTLMQLVQDARRRAP
jgi:hypothetical protein